MLKILSALIASVTLGIGAGLLVAPVDSDDTAVLRDFVTTFVGEVIAHDKSSKELIVRGTSSHLEENATIKVLYDSNTIWAQQNILMKEGFLIGIRYTETTASTLGVGDNIFIGTREDFSSPAAIITPFVTQEI